MDSDPEVEDSLAHVIGTLLLKHPQQIHETALKKCVKWGNHNVGMKFLSVSDEETLVTLSSSDPDVLMSQFQSNSSEVTVKKRWKHSQDSPAIVLVKNLPPNCDLQSYLRDTLDVKVADEIEFSEDKSSATVELCDPADLPLLICQTHIFKRKSLQFVDMSMADESELVVEDIESEEVDDMFDSPAFVPEDALQYLKVVFVENAEMLEESLLESSMKFTFANEPYSLTVSECIIKGGNEVIMSFEEKEGVSKIISNPPTTILGASIEISPLASIDDEDRCASTSKSLTCRVLIIEDLPSYIPSPMCESFLKKMFSNKGYVVADYKMDLDKNQAWFWFSDDNAITELVDDPPDHSTLCGHPIKYTSAISEDFPDLHEQPCILLIKGLPSKFREIQNALKFYIRNIAQNAPILYCHVHGQEAIVKFGNDQIAKQIIQDVPNPSLMGNELKFSLVSEHSAGITTDSATSLEDPTELRNAGTKNSTVLSALVSDASPLKKQPPTPCPRTAFKHSSFLIDNLPDNCDQHALQYFLEALTRINCKDIKLKIPQAAVHLSEPIDMKVLQSLLATYEFLEVPLTINPISPSFSLLIKSSKELDNFVVQMYCRKFSQGKNPKLEQKSTTEYIVAFNSKTEYDNFMKEHLDGHHCIGSNEVQITPYHPVLAMFEDPAPPPVPPRPRSTSLHPSTIEQSQYQYTPHTEDIDEPMVKYLMHILPELNSELIRMHAEAHLEANSIEIRPLGRAHYVADWNEKIVEILNKFQAKFHSDSVEIPEDCKFIVLERLQHYQQNHKDFHFILKGCTFEISGCTSSVNEAAKLISTILEEEIIVTQEFKKEHYQIEYLLKFGKHEIQAIKPPVKYEQDENSPEILKIEGVRMSLREFKEIAQRKLADIHHEYIPLTKAAHRLLTSSRGLDKLNECLKDIFDLICYFYVPIKTDISSHNACIVSANSGAVAMAKMNFMSLCKEEKVVIPAEKVNIPLSKEWQAKIGELTGKYFVSIRACNEIITVTGSDDDTKKVCGQLSSFLDSMHEATEDVEVEEPKWKVVSTHCRGKVAKVKEKADRLKVRLMLSEADETGSTVVIGLQGGLHHVENVKVMIQQMTSEVQTKSIKLSPKPGLQKVEGKIKLECYQLSQTFKVEIRHELIHEEPTIIPDIPVVVPPKCLFRAKSKDGVSLNVFEGDYTKKSCDAIVVFAPKSVSLDDEVYNSLTVSGGEEVYDAIKASLTSGRHLVPASVSHVTEKTGNLKCEAILHVVLPPYTIYSNAEASLQRVIKELFETTLTKYNSFLFCPITSPPLNYPTSVLARVLASSFSMCGMYCNGLVIQSFVSNVKEADGFAESLSVSGFSIDYLGSRNIPFSSLKPHANSLEKVIKVVKGSITDYQADVYINSTNSNMSLSNGALSRLYKQKCGKPLAAEVEEYLKKNGELKHEAVAVTGANNLMACKIYHISLKQKDPSGVYIQSFKRAFEKVLLTAKQERHTSIAIPCLRVANLNYSPEVSASVLFEVVASFHRRYPTAITEFIFVVYKSSDEKAFNDEYQKLINPQKSVHAAAIPMPIGSMYHGGTIKLEVFKGNIAKEQVKVIVNSTSYDMREDANQISKAVISAAGDVVRNACSKLVGKGETLKNGNVISTVGGNLQCTEVYHVHVPGKSQKDNPPTVGEASLMKKVIRSCLDKAEASKHESLSLPAFCLGIGNYTIEQCGRLMFESIEDFVETSPQHLKHVRIVIYDQKLHDNFHSYFRQHFPNAASNIVSLQTSPNATLDFSVTRHDKASTNPQSVLPQKLHCRKSSVVFTVYGIMPETLAVVEKKLTTFINEIIVTEKVHLEDTRELFTKLDIEKLYKLAYDKCVEIEFKGRDVVLVGEESEVGKLCRNIEIMKNNFLRSTADLRMYEWFAEDPSGHNLIRYSEGAMKKIEAAYQRKLASVECDVDGITVTVDLSNMVEYDETASVKRVVCRRQKAMDIEPPKEWRAQPHDTAGNKQLVYLETILPSSDEYSRATKRFQETSKTKCTITSVKRIQNPCEYSRYMTLKATWENTLGQGKVKEKEVFHGTKLSSIMSICSQGFNRIFAADANAAYFGRGVYFALHSSYSIQDKYSAKDKDGCKHILVCTLLVGNFTKGEEGMKATPNLPDNEMVTYDTLVDNVATPTIFVAMKDAQAYPKYWITFKQD